VNDKQHGWQTSASSHLEIRYNCPARYLSKANLPARGTGPSSNKSHLWRSWDSQKWHLDLFSCFCIFYTYVTL